MSRVTVQVANGNRSIVSEKAWIVNMLESPECAVPPAQSVIDSLAENPHEQNRTDRTLSQDFEGYIFSGGFWQLMMRGFQS
jgi:hypothetical protein